MIYYIIYYVLYYIIHYMLYIILYYYIIYILYIIYYILHSFLIGHHVQSNLKRKQLLYACLFRYLGSILTGMDKSSHLDSKQKTESTLGEPESYFESLPAVMWTISFSKATPLNLSQQFHQLGTKCYMISGVHSQSNHHIVPQKYPLMVPPENFSEIRVSLNYDPYIQGSYQQLPSKVCQMIFLYFMSSFLVDDVKEYVLFL